ncbi:MFS transporter [Pseudonocardia kujensis]|uniref:MFS transporter n=1 Tax=Pseudonocardia kujensis TaxID=1128675 RepID=UPI001E481D50|nr:MFS transporter [Pseudonocardia kujensis]MCE0761828.1 MFS transporter [Pseudonocardia kujensis]
MTSPPAATAPARPAAPTDQGGELSHKQIVTILIGLMLGMFLAALDQTVVSTAIRTIADDLGGLSQQAWATTAFLITGTISTPLYGKLSDIFGRKPLFLTAISIFIVGSVLCTFSTSMYMLAGFRAVQGLGAGGLFALALTILGDIVPPRERARYQGYMLAVFGTSSVLGPVIGGVLSGQATIAGIDGWRWIFLVNVPIGAVALVVVAKVLNVPHTSRRHRIDWPGALTLAIGLVPLLIVAEQGREWGWGSTSAIVCYVIGAVGLVAFVLCERLYGDDALLPLRLFRNGVFTLTSLAGVVIGMGMFGGIALFPQFLQIVHGVTPTESGFLMLPLVAGIMCASVVSGQVTARTGKYKIFPILGTALMAGALVILHFRLNVDIALWEFDLYMAMFGLGLGCCMQTLVLAVQNAVPARDMGVATASSTFFRQMGGTLGTAIFLSIMFSTVGDKITAAFRGDAGQVFRSALADPALVANPANQQIVQGARSGDLSAASGVLNDSAFLQQIDARLARPFLVGFTDSMTLTYLVAACVIALAFVIVLFIKELPLRTMSGAQARLAEEAGTPPAPAAVTAAVEPIEEFRALHNGHAGNGHAPAGPGTVGAAVAARNGAGQAAGPDGGRHHLAGEPAPLPTEPAPAPAGVGASTGYGPGPEVNGIVHRADGTGLPEAVVTVTDPAGHQEGRAVTGPDGGYRIPLANGGTYLVVATSGAFQPYAAMVAVADRPVRHDVPLAGTCAVRGLVRDGEGTPVDDATITLIDARGDVAATGRPDAGGRYRLEGVPEGRYTLTVTGGTFAPVAAAVELRTGTVTDHDVELPRRARLVGTVVAASDGRGVGEALATLIDGRGTVVASTVTGPDGSFVFENLPGGTYTLTASGYAPVAAVVQVGSGGVTTADVEFPAPARTGATRNGAVANGTAQNGAQDGTVGTGATQNGTTEGVR